MSCRLPASLLSLSAPFSTLRIAIPIPISIPPPLPPPPLPRRLPPPPPRPRLFSTTAAAYVRVKRKPFNPFAAAISKKRKEGNLARQAELAKERQAQAVDPVLGGPTPFLESLARVPPPLPPLDAVLAAGAGAGAGTAGAARATATVVLDDQLNHYVTPAELLESLRRSRALAEPVAADPEYGVEAEHKAAFERLHDHTVEAMRRILALGAGNSADRTRAHKQACIARFGRHVTDSQLPADPGSSRAAAVDTGKTPRAGPDTGSSEVQAAILTVKIQALARALHRDDGHDTKDKHNKRNLRLLVHRRQKLLKYLKRKEKGGVRYRNVMDALGLDDDAVHRELFL